MPPSGRDLISYFYERLPEAEKAALAAALSAAAAIGATIYLVGGPVRDLILRRPSLDIDVAVEGDIVALAAALEAAGGRRVVRHGRFGTATLRGDGFTIDFARTRSETYARPGALPDVEPAGIGEDLARRDFSVNAIALRLGEPAGALLDPFDGAKDIEAGVIRVLHDRSFQDDATRMLRACRYAARLGFEIEPSTRSLIARDLSYVDSISPARLRQELTRALKEETAPEATDLMDGLGVLAAMNPRLGLGQPPNGESRRVSRSWSNAIGGRHHAPVEELGFCMIAMARTEHDVDAVSARLHLKGRIEMALRDLVRLPAAFAKLEQPPKPSEAVALFDGFAPAAVWAFGLKSGLPAERLALEYLGTWRKVRPTLNGFDLRRLGIEGVRTGQALRRLRQARLDGEARSRADEIELIEREFKPDIR